MTSWKSSITLRAPSIGNERKSSDYTQTSGDCILPRIGAYEVPVASTEGRKSDRPDQSRSTCTLTERSSSRKATGLSPRRLQLDPGGGANVRCRLGRLPPRLGEAKDSPALQRGL